MDRLRYVLRAGAGAVRGERGQALMEYGIIILFVAIPTLLALGAFRGQVGELYQTAAAAIP